MAATPCTWTRHVHVCGCQNDPGCRLSEGVSAELLFVLQAPILTVLKRHGEMLELVLSSLQVNIGAALLFGIACHLGPVRA